MNFNKKCGPGVPPKKPLTPLECIQHLNIRRGKLLVLDLDKTLCNFDWKLQVCGNSAIGRPYLHEFLKNMNKIFDLAIWSATCIETILFKLHTLDILENENYEIRLILDKRNLAMINTSARSATKPLHIIWKKFEEYNRTNTIIVDDLQSNFYLNPDNGLKIKPYTQDMHSTDNELVLVGHYLNSLAKNCTDFTTVNHSMYQEYY